MADAPVSLDALYRIAGALDRTAVPYAFIGGIALSVWGVPRATFDLDLTVSVSGTEIATVLDGLQAAGCTVDEPFRRGFRDRLAGMETIHLHLRAGRTLLAVDMFLATTPFLRAVMERRVLVDVGRGPLPVFSAADLILFELLADRKKDRADVANMLSVQGVPDRAYLEHWAALQGVTGRLADALRDAR